jgi:hypothetical protein
VLREVRYPIKKKKNLQKIPSVCNICLRLVATLVLQYLLSTDGHSGTTVFACDSRPLWYYSICLRLAATLVQQYLLATGGHPDSKYHLPTTGGSPPRMEQTLTAVASMHSMVQCKVACVSQARSRTEAELLNFVQVSGHNLEGT